MRAVLFFCCNPAIDPVAPSVFSLTQSRFALKPLSIRVDDKPVMLSHDEDGNELWYVRTDSVLSLGYAKYLPVLNEFFQRANVAVIVNWHEGMNAPDRIFTVHSTGSVVAGPFCPVDAQHVRNLLCSLERFRCELQLDSFATMSEGTHWSGELKGASPGLLSQYSVPILDLEIGSSPEAWANAQAVEVMTHAVRDVLRKPKVPALSALCVGGPHIDRCYVESVLVEGAERPVALAHILPNQWLGMGGYDGPAALAKLEACAASVIGGVDLVVHHDKAKGSIKGPLRELAKRLGRPLFNHRQLRKWVSAEPELPR